ncbi:helix-turn-helix domain-containing protein [Novosphingobium sp. JCM 18896]|uniref:helix-turn-helix domain-containing protein n=1 Tax=Novosphingobium sp. JCM 18896 TaxID=2989731 RepID=UPI0022238378|nr:helix-turn-helix transcriptional regulator [Novosphingobium sp. JCM 18896]MCW1430684.1 helix-turn-helix domain-containing protein [Novosphingobium sp. JCM 18896]
METAVVEPSKAFASQLRSLREARGLSVRALADSVGVSKVTIWKWERGDNEPRARMATALARALEVSPVQLGLTAGPGASELTDDGAIAGMSTDRGSLEVRAQESAETLAEVIARAKQMIADASGTGRNNITISIEY